MAEPPRRVEGGGGIVGAVEASGALTGGPHGWQFWDGHWYHLDETLGVWYVDDTGPPAP